MECPDCGASLPAEARFCLQCGARVQAVQSAAADPLRDALERAIGFQYRIERLLGRGGMGAVYLAHELALDRDVAIKVLPPEHAGTPEMRERFRREARTAARLTHPNIVPLHTFGEVDGLVYFVMGYVAGESLASRLKRLGVFGSEDARTLIVGVADALDYAHRHGIVHRDLKPDNILIDGESGAPMLTDFGIAKASLGDATHLTSTGQIVGTPHYMSPEQALGRDDIDGRSDLYSLGVVAYEMVSGRRPFDASGALDTLTQRLTQDPRSLRLVAPAAADDLVLAIMRCLEREPANRWPDARSFRATLAAADDEAEEALGARILRAGTAMAPIPVIIGGYVEAFQRFDPPVRDLGPLKGLLVGLVGSSLLFLAGGAIVLRRQGLDMTAIVQTALRQPRWWRFWYPKRFRRRGDVWDRLPPRIRRLRIQITVTACLMLLGIMPLQIGLLLRHHRVGSPLSLVGLAPLLLMFIERGRTTKYVATTLGVTSTEASKILSAGSWRTSVWQRAPAAALLRGDRTARRPDGPQPETPATEAMQPQADPSDAPTRM